MGFSAVKEDTIVLKFKRVGGQGLALFFFAAELTVHGSQFTVTANIRVDNLLHAATLSFCKLPLANCQLNIPRATGNQQLTTDSNAIKPHSSV